MLLLFYNYTRKKRCTTKSDIPARIHRIYFDKIANFNIWCDFSAFSLPRKRFSSRKIAAFYRNNNELFRTGDTFIILSQRSFFFFFFLLTREMHRLHETRTTRFLFNRLSLDLTKTSPDVCQRATGIRDEYGVLRLSSFSIHRSRGQTFRNTSRIAPSFSRDTHSHFLSFSHNLPLPPSPGPPFISDSFFPLSTFLQPDRHLYVCVKEEEELQHPPASVLRLAIIVMDPTVLSSPPVNQMNPINALRRLQDEEVTSRDALAIPSEACVRFKVSVFFRSLYHGD